MHLFGLRCAGLLRIRFRHSNPTNTHVGLHTTHSITRERGIITNFYQLRKSRNFWVKNPQFCFENFVGFVDGGALVGIMSLFSPRGQALLQSILSFIPNHPFIHLHPFINTGIHLLLIKVYIILFIADHTFFHSFVCIHFTLIDMHQFVNLHSIILFIKIADSIHSLIAVHAIIHPFVTIKNCINQDIKYTYYFVRHSSFIYSSNLLYVFRFIYVGIYTVFNYSFIT